MANGGKRPGAGRKPKTDEEKSKRLAIAAILAKYKTEEKGFEALISSGEPSLIKWVYEHAYGKPPDKLEHTGELSILWKEVKNYGANDQTDKSS